MENKDKFRLQVRKWDAPYSEQSLFYGEDINIAPNENETLFIDDESGKLHEYVVVKRETVLRSSKDGNICLVVVYVKEPDVA